MRRLAVVALLALAGLFCFQAPAQAQPCQWNYSEPGNVATATYCGNVVVNGNINVATIAGIIQVSQFPTYELAVAAANLANKPLNLDVSRTAVGTSTLNTFLTCGGGILTIPTGATVNADVFAPPVKCFSITGTGTFNLGHHTDLMYSEWFGATNDGSSDDTLPIAQAIAINAGSGSQLVFLGSQNSAGYGYSVTKFDLTGHNYLNIRFAADTLIYGTATIATDFVFGCGTGFNPGAPTYSCNYDYITGFPYVYAMTGTHYTRSIELYGMAYSVFSGIAAAQSNAGITEYIGIDYTISNVLNLGLASDANPGQLATNGIHLGSLGVNNNEIHCQYCSRGSDPSNTGIGLFAQGFTNHFFGDLSGWRQGLVLSDSIGSTYQIYAENNPAASIAIASDAASHIIDNNKISGYVAPGTGALAVNLIASPSSNTSPIRSLDLSALDIGAASGGFQLYGSLLTNLKMPAQPASGGPTSWIGWQDTTRPTWIDPGSAVQGVTPALNGTTPVTVSNTYVTSGSTILFIVNTGAACSNPPYVTGISAGSSFNVASAGACTSTYTYRIFNP